jgi:hypothetical protein
VFVALGSCVARANRTLTTRTVLPSSQGERTIVKDIVRSLDKSIGWSQVVRRGSSFHLTYCCSLEVQVT